jgi:hypothetical protein
MHRVLDWDQRSCRRMFESWRRHNLDSQVRKVLPQSNFQKFLGYDFLQIPAQQAKQTIADLEASVQHVTQQTHNTIQQLSEAHTTQMTQSHQHIDQLQQHVSQLLTHLTTEQSGAKVLEAKLQEQAAEFARERVNLAEELTVAVRDVKLHAENEAMKSLQRFGAENALRSVHRGRAKYRVWQQWKEFVLKQQVKCV